MQILNHNETAFSIAHFQGNSYYGYIAVAEYFKNQAIVLPENITIVTACNNPGKSMLIEQLEKNGIAFINMAKKGGSWNNLKKPGYINKALKEVTTEFVFILDAADVLFTGAGLDKLFEHFNESGKKLIFNATKNNYPNELIDKVPDRDFRGEFRYLNAGCCFGRTDTAALFYGDVRDLIEADTVHNPKKSEQLVVRHIFKDRTEEVDFDCKCNIFQTFGGTELKFLEGNERYAIV
jgi:hypothetical protein